MRHDLVPAHFPEWANELRNMVILPRRHIAAQASADSSAGQVDMNYSRLISPRGTPYTANSQAVDGAIQDGSAWPFRKSSGS
jgi:hypothetical protein